MIKTYIKNNQLKVSRPTIFQIVFEGFAKRKVLVISLLFLLVTLPILYLVIKYQSPIQAAWMDDSWGYRKAVAIPSHTTLETNVYVTVPTFDATDTSKFQADCGDLRFTKQNGEQLPYYVVDCDATANIHVQFDSLPAGASTYFMYYGNPSAQNGFSSADFSTAATGLGTQTLASEEKSAGPVAYWKFDEGYGTSANNSTSVTGINGTLSGTTKPAWKPESECISGKCLFFDGSTSYINAADNSAYNFSTGNFTLSAWIRTSNTTQDMAIMDKYNTAASEAGFDFRVNSSTYGGKLEFMVSAGLNGGTGRRHLLESTTAVNDGKWHHVVVVRDAGVSTKFYIDGVYKSDAGTNNAGDLSNTDTFGIGKHVYTTYGTYFNGFIDEPKIYNYARTAAQVKADFASKGSGSIKGTAASLGSSSKNLDALSNGLVGYWKMDEAAANSCTGGVNDSCDSSGNANNGAWNGNSTSAAGKYGNSTSYDGTNSYIDIPNFALGSDGSYPSFTLSTWVYSNSKSRQVIFGDNQNNCDGLEYSGNDINLGADANCVTWTNAKPSYSAWHHIAVTVNNSQTAELFVDGTSSGTKDISGFTQYWGTGNEIITNLGKDYCSSDCWFSGSLDETRIYNRALSGKEVRDLYAWAPGPVAYYNSDEGSGTNLYDRSGNGNNSSSFSGSPSWVSGKFGKALSFNGSTDYVNIGSSTTLNTPVFTVGYWWKPSSITAWAGPIQNRIAGQYGFQVVNDTSSTSVYTPHLVIWNGTSEVAQFKSTTTYNIPFTNWRHFEWTYDGTTANLYVDGVQQPTTTSAISIYTVSGVLIGKGYGTIGGGIDDGYIYNYARTSKQITEDMNAGHPVGGSPVGSQLGYWKFDEGYGGTANDTVANQNLTITSASWTNSGKFGKALNFDNGVAGSEAYYDDVTSSKYDLINDFSFGAWVYRTNTPSSQARIISKGDKYLLFTTTNNVPICWMSNLTATSLTATSALPLNQWTYVMCTYKDNARKLYINGILNAQDTPTGTITPDDTDLVVGNYDLPSDSYRFRGIIDEVKIYSSALTADEVLLDYNHGSAMVLGSASTDSTGAVADNSSAREYCVPGDTTSCSAPVAQWNFDEGSGNSVNDTSGNGNTGTWSGTGTHWTQGKVGKGGKFNGSDDYVTKTDTTGSVLDITGPMTLETWIKMDTDYVPTGYTHCIVGKGSRPRSSQYSGPYQICWAGASIEFEISSISASDYLTFGNPSKGVWHHLAGVFDGTNLKTYLDGSFVSSKVSAVTTIQTDNSSLWANRNQYATSLYKGSIDGVKLYNYARTPAQIAWDYNRGSPVGWWKMDECQGVVAYDSAATSDVAGNNGTITIGATGTNTSVGTCTGSAGEAWKDGATGKYNSSLEFDGTDDYVTVANSSFYDLTDFTYSAWINPSATNGWRSIIDIDNDEQLLAVNGGDVAIYGRCGADPGGGYGSISTGTWYHVVWTVSGSAYKVYLNGKEIGSGSGCTAGIDADRLNIGAGYTGTSPNELFTGQIDDVRIYNYALTANQVKLLFNEGSSIRFGPSTGSP